MSTIQINNVSKSYGATHALNGVSLNLEAEKIYGLLGRNGAGKTTLIEIITNKLFADTGEVLIDGEHACENDRAQAKLYCMTEGNVHPWNMKVKEGFRWACEFHPRFDSSYAITLAEKFRLDADKQIRRLSSGYSSVFKLILTLASGAPVLIFDEPVLGLDAAFRELFYKELIALYSVAPKTMIIATHLVDEVADLLEEVIILKEGAVALDEPVESVLQRAYTVSGEGERVDTFAAGKKVIHEETIGKFKAATIFQQRERDDNQRSRELGLEITSARLQHVFVSLTGS